MIIWSTKCSSILTHRETAHWLCEASTKSLGIQKCKHLIANVNNTAVFTKCSSPLQTL